MQNLISDLIAKGQPGPTSSLVCKHKPQWGTELRDYGISLLQIVIDIYIYKEAASSKPIVLSKEMWWL